MAEQQTGSLVHHLVRSHGLGNDYLVVDPAELPVEMTPDRVALLCDRHRGVGSDGLLRLSAPRGEAGRFGLKIVNPDGSEAEKSGNGIRIFARWLHDTGRVSDTRFTVVTLGGDVPVEVHVRPDGLVEAVTADMGAPAFREELRQIEVAGESIAVVALSMGNPHCVVPGEALDVGALRRLGPTIERHKAFPERTNVQLARYPSRGRAEALIWERGAGETLASGSSACAVAAAGQRLGLLDDDVEVAMQGGSLTIRRDAATEHLWMTGPVEEIARITLSDDLLRRLRAIG